MGSTYFKEDQNSLDFNTFVLTKRMLSCLHHDLVWRCIEMLTTSHKFPITWRKCWVFLHVIHVSNMCSMSIGTCEWDINCGIAWMGTWFKCIFQKLEFLYCWHFYHDAILLSSNNVLCAHHLHYPWKYHP